MTITRLSQLGVGAQPYQPFAPKAGQRGSELFTRLSQVGVGAKRYAPFLSKAAADAPQELFLGFPAISPAVVEGDGYGILPDLVGIGIGYVGVAGRGRGTLSRLRGDAAGEVVQFPTELELLLLLAA